MASAPASRSSAPSCHSPAAAGVGHIDVVVSARKCSECQ
uniref:Uncharacterized protein n=1 Tax=Leersia perrieri TaxID=77586 RepID=A0A0D9XW62_9ORYZ